MRTFALIVCTFVAAVGVDAQTLFQIGPVREYRESRLEARPNASLGVVTLERAVQSSTYEGIDVFPGLPAIDGYILPATLFVSWNSSLPYGDRDGALWQGRGANAIASGGIFARGDWWSLTIAPEVAGAENRPFPLGPSGFAQNPYGHVATSIDLPQRMGDDTWTWAGPGQSEARLYWRSLTAGVGSQNIVLGPAVINPIMLSDHAAGFPHVDVGILPVETPLGLIESRAFWGLLRESVAYDEDPDNDTTYLSFLTVNVRPRLFPMLTLGAYRTVAVNGAEATNRFLWQVFDPRPRGGSRDTGDAVYGTDRVDQMVGVSLEVAFPESGFRGYVEWAREDFASNFFSFVQIPYHSAAWTAGAEQRLLQTPAGTLVGLLEFTRTLQSRNYFLDGQYSRSFFYNHHVVRHGHTHAGQLLGAPAGPGTEGGTIRFRWVDSINRVEFFLDRYAVNADYVFANAATMDRSFLDTEVAAGVAYERALGDLSVRVEGVFVNRRGYNYESALIRNSAWLATSLVYAP